jgi:gluconolactonase
MNGSTRTNIEGPVWIGDTLYVSEFPFAPAPAARVLALGPGDKVSVAVASSGSNGMATDAMGNLISTDHVQGAIVRITLPLSGAPQVLVGAYMGTRFNSPNDLVVRSDGTIYFSDPDYQAPSQHPQQQTRVYRLAPGAKEATVVDATRSEPNGVTLSIDESKLYVAGSDGIFTYAVQPDGSVASPGTRLNGFNGAADGLGIDCAGNLYAASQNRIAVLSPAGMEIGSIPMNQAESVTNVAFGGPEHKTLFITAMGTGAQRGLWKAELNVPGFPY